ncbi:MAG: hypothetical protein Q4D54_07220 [Eubacteriales bacterium]|nr:hypothetical protein [Lachnospiraceae bacterium]MDO5127521.1 hypothetical protein [Eubacteriales bacterium]
MKHEILRETAADVGFALLSLLVGEEKGEVVKRAMGFTGKDK